MLSRRAVLHRLELAHGRSGPRPLPRNHALDQNSQSIGRLVSGRGGLGGLICRAPVPRQQIAELVRLGPPGHHALQHVGEVGHPTPRPRDVTAAVLVQLERQSGTSRGQERKQPSALPSFSAPTNQSVHHADEGSTDFAGSRTKLVDRGMMVYQAAPGRPATEAGCDERERVQ